MNAKVQSSSTPLYTSSTPLHSALIPVHFLPYCPSSLLNRLYDEDQANFSPVMKINSGFTILCSCFSKLRKSVAREGSSYWLMCMSETWTILHANKSTSTWTVQIMLVSLSDDMTLVGCVNNKHSRTGTILFSNIAKEFRSEVVCIHYN